MPWQPFVGPSATSRAGNARRRRKITMWTSNDKVRHFLDVLIRKDVQEVYQNCSRCFANVCRGINVNKLILQVSVDISIMHSFFPVWTYEIYNFKVC